MRQPCVCSRAVWLMACGSAVITDHEARDVHRLEVQERETSHAREIVIVPAGIGRADQPSAVSIVGQDDSIVSECGDDNSRLRTCGGARGSGSTEAFSR